MKIYIFVGLIILFSCANKNQTEIQEETDTTLYFNDTAHTNKVKKIFYNVPSPLEMSKVIQRSGVSFRKDLLFPYTEVNKYTSTSQQAIMLGLYGSDLSYVRLFEQIQLALNYISSLKILYDALEIPQDQGSKAIARMEKNINNKDSLLKIIAETYAIADNYFKENGRGNVATLVILGGWIESLYISTHIANYDDPSNKEIIDRIGEQKHSLYNLIELIKSYKNDNTLQSFLEPLERLKKVYDEVKIEYTRGRVETDSINKLTTIYSEVNVILTKETFEKIKKLAEELRKEIIKI
ncbi:MAG: hypothetical protein N3A01_08725 [Bacteroidales bacterium]|nr:hypothetical protein [Bacteroidales bacterium]